MKINQDKLLHYVLIMIMMFAPMRSIMAMQLSHCDMASHGVGHSVDMSAGSNAVMSDSSVAYDMMAMSMATSSSAKKAESSHDCCSGKGRCTGDCDMRISVSMLIQIPSYSPNFINITESVALISDLIKKEYTPPFRPPLLTL